MPEKKGAPGEIVTGYAFKYACSFYDYAKEQFPELSLYTKENARGSALQTAIVVATLIMMERRAGGAGTGQLREGVVRSFAPSVQEKQMKAIQELSCRLLQRERGGMRPDAIPSLAGLSGLADAELTKALGTWLAQAIKKKAELSPEDQKLAAAMGKSAWTSAKMIVRML
jgi:hypothetical protein